MGSPRLRCENITAEIQVMRHHVVVMPDTEFWITCLTSNCMNRRTGDLLDDYDANTHSRLGGRLDRHERGTSGRPSGQGQGGRICEDLLALRRRLLLHPGHRYLYQDRRLSAGRHHLQRWLARRTG